MCALSYQCDALIQSNKHRFPVSNVGRSPPALRRTFEDGVSRSNILSRFRDIRPGTPGLLPHVRGPPVPVGAVQVQGELHPHVPGGPGSPGRLQPGDRDTEAHVKLRAGIGSYEGALDLSLLDIGFIPSTPCQTLAV